MLKLGTLKDWLKMSPAEINALAERAEGRLDEIVEEREELQSRAAKVLAKADDEADLNSRDQNRVERFTAQANALTKEEVAIEGFLEWANEAEEPKATPEPIENQNGRRPVARNGGHENPRSFLAMFPDAQRHETQWRSFGEFARIVGRGLIDPRLSADGARSGSGEDGGFTIPEQYVSSIFDTALESEIVRPRARVFPVEYETLNVTGLELEDHTGGVLAGLGIEWLAEGQKGSKQKPKFKKVKITPVKGMIYVDASTELAEDSPTFESDLFGQMARSTAFGFDEAFLWGNGVGQPLGIFNSGALITATPVGSQETDTITYVNVLAMAARLTPGSWNRAVFVASQTTLPQLLKLQFQQTTDAGALISDQSVSAPVFRINADGSYSLLGRPLILSEKMKTLGDLGDILLADFDAYAVGLRREAAIARSIEPGWDTDEVAYRIRMRADGRPLVTAPVTPMNGATVSPFVTLGAR